MIVTYLEYDNTKISNDSLTFASFVPVSFSFFHSSSAERVSPGLGRGLDTQDLLSEEPQLQQQQQLRSAAGLSQDEAEQQQQQQQQLVQ